MYLSGHISMTLQQDLLAIIGPLLSLGPMLLLSVNLLRAPSIEHAATEGVIGSAGQVPSPQDERLIELSSRFETQRPTSPVPDSLLAYGPMGVCFIASRCLLSRATVPTHRRHT